MKTSACDLTRRIPLRTVGCHGIQVEDRDRLAAAIEEGLDNASVPTMIDVVVTHGPAEMPPVSMTARSRSRRRTVCLNGSSVFMASSNNPN